MSNPGAVSKPLIVAALIVQAAATPTVLLWHPRTFWVHQLEGLIPVVLALTAVVFLVATMVRAKVRTVGFVVRPGVGFVAPAERKVGYVVAAALLMVSTFLAHDAVHQRASGTTAAQRLMDLGMLVVDIIGESGFLAAVYVYVFLVLTGTLRLELTTDGVRLRSIWRRGARWDELMPFHRADQDSVMLLLNPPGQFLKLPLHLIRIHTLFLADAIRYYVDHPERRAGIGTQAEYDHLMLALGAVPVPR